MKKCQRVSFYLSHKQYMDVRFMCLISGKTLSEFIRQSIQEKLLHSKNNQEDSSV